nr:T-cell immunomodulatory protein isoform X1 [Leptinotarsa decemlineata]XP_023030133.1 T-cell immunomodulatory protein isoform X2 [Leptinotarsa decemlineata]XP_023030134.1 T-cell immunomodulatory protein isoform X3 [Leptinotarsa decemlineata]
MGHLTILGILYCINVVIFHAYCSNITKLAFGDETEGMPAAFGDFNSDELTDVFVLRGKGKTVEILLAHEEEPLLRRHTEDLTCHFTDHLITSVVPGDFDGDALMDVLVTTIRTPPDKDGDSEVSYTYVYIIWGGATYLNCSNEDSPLIKMIGQPLAIDYNGDMVIDLFGQNEKKDRMFWVFNKNRAYPTEIRMKDNRHPTYELSRPHAHAFLDLNDDYMADLFITTKYNFEIWLGKEDGEEKFVYNRTIPHPVNPIKSEEAVIIGQSLFIDIELLGRMDLITPVCFDEKCKNSALMLYSKLEQRWINLQVNFKDDNSNLWGFHLRPGSRYTDVITLRSGDFNMDGFPDILATLSPAQTDNSLPQSFLLENVPCQNACGKLKRTYAIKWSSLNPFKNGTVMAAFFDFYQDGILDCIIVSYDGRNYKTAAFKNSLDYDANFVKVMVLTGLTNKNNAMIMGRVGKKRRTYGTNLPGPSISYKTTTQESIVRHGLAAQLPQSAHFSLNLPYSIFGLGRTPNFVDKLTVGLSKHSRYWTQIIPNSQMVVIPWPTNDPSRWKAQLFVTPSKLILMSVAALTTLCGLITVIIGVLHWKERQEDKKERMSESHRFHFDAM